MLFAPPLQAPKKSFELFSAHAVSSCFIDFDGVGTQYNAIGDMPQEGRPPY